jgi:hypothetical protein
LERPSTPQIEKKRASPPHFTTPKRFPRSRSPNPQNRRDRYNICFAAIAENPPPIFAEK